MTRLQVSLGAGSREMLNCVCHEATWRRIYLGAAKCGGSPSFFFFLRGRVGAITMLG